MGKASVTLAGVPLSAVGAIAWRFVSGVVPYSTTFTVHRDVWNQKLKNQIGQPLELRIEDSRGVVTTVKQVYILHTAPSDSPYRVSFVVADKRWKWAYPMIAKDFNIPRRTGDRTAKNQVPVETQVVVDQYDYLAYSLDDGRQRWTAKRAIEHVLEIMHEDDPDDGGFVIRGFPILDAEDNSGQFSLQNVMLRDSADAALARLLSYVPGADVFVSPAGKTVVYDAADLSSVEQHLRQLPDSTYDGDYPAFIDRRKIRPKNVIVHYQREIEVLFDFTDDFGQTSATPGPNTPFLENVIPVVDPDLTVNVWDPLAQQHVTRPLQPGTYLPVKEWLEIMNDLRPPQSFPWTFETIKRHWVVGDLDGALGGGGLDQDDTANISMRIQALKQHFRQTFRVNRKYMERVRELVAIRAGLIDSVQGIRAPAAVWGQACIIPSDKGKRMAARRNTARAGVYRNIDQLAKSENDASLEVYETAPSPAAVRILDRDAGIFRIEWILSPYGDAGSFVPCHVVDRTGSRQVVPFRDLEQQDQKPMGAGMQVESGTNGIFLRDTLRMKVMMTIIPTAPNNELQFHREVIRANDVSKIFKSEFRIQGGEGPDLEVFVPPGEAQARFAYTSAQFADSTLVKLLGLDEDDPRNAGIDGNFLPGFQLMNAERFLTSHATSYAAELLAAFADNMQGTVVTPVPRQGLDIVGNMAGATVRVAGAPSAKVDAVHEFPGQQRPISRFAMMSNEARGVVLGIVAFQTEN